MTHELYEVKSAEKLVLVVEDTELLRVYLESALTHHGYSVVCAATALEALAVMERCGDTVAMLIIDVGLPELDGVRLNEKISESRPGIPTLFITGNVGHPALVNCPASARVLPKPFGMEQLREALDIAFRST